MICTPAVKRTVADWKLKHAESVKQLVRSGGSDMMAVADFVNSAAHKTAAAAVERRDSLLGSDRYVFPLFSPLLRIATHDRRPTRS